MDIEAFDILKQGIVIPAMPLALTKEFRLDERRQRALVRYYLDAGAGGIASAVHTTQFEIRNYPEIFQRLLALVIEEISDFEKRTAKRIIKIGGICGDTKQAIAESKLLVSLGYDIALVSPTAFPDTKELIPHYQQISKVIPLFGFYLQSAIGGPELSYDFWKTVLLNKKIIGIKIAPFNRYKTIEVMRAICDAGRADDLVIYSGNDDSIVTDLITPYVMETKSGPVELRFSGGLLGHWCVWTKKAVELLEEVKKVRDSSFIPRELIIKGQRITDSNAAFFDAKNNFKGSIAGLHEVLRRQGFFEDIICFEPNGYLSLGQKEEIERVYMDYPELNDDSFVKKHLKKWLS